MPKTTLSEDELADVYFILSKVIIDDDPINNNNGGLWQKAGLYANTINSKQYNALAQLGVKMLGSDKLFDKYFNGWKEAQKPTIINAVTDLNALLAAANAAVLTADADALTRAAAATASKALFDTADAAEAAAKAAIAGLQSAFDAAKSALDSA